MSRDIKVSDHRTEAMSDRSPGDAFDLLDGTRLSALLRGTFGRPIEYHPQLDSTQARAHRLALEGAPEGTVVIADTQVAGRGRMSRTWFSPAGVNVYLSLVLRPEVEPARVPLLNLLAAVAGREAFLESGLPVFIKWPNDLMAGGPHRKLAGILAELRATASEVEFVILGVGFNLNLSSAELPPELTGIATSYRIETGSVVDRARFIASFLFRLEQWYRRFAASGSDEVLEHWRAGSVMWGREIRFEESGRVRKGVARDIDPNGALIVETERGIEHISAGDIHLIWKPTPK